MQRDYEYQLGLRGYFRLSGDAAPGERASEPIRETLCAPDPNSLLFAPMPKPHRYTSLPDEKLTPIRPIPGVSIEAQENHMRELRQAQNQIVDGHAVRDGLMQAWALSNALSRHDMAVAAGLVKSRVDQLIRDATEHDIARRNAAAAERTARHMAT
jgi:hypothetical protein